MRIRALSLVDITKTGKHKNNSKDDKAIFQNANYLTFQNCIMLRSNIISDTIPKIETMNVVNTTFGTSYSGEHKVWNMIFDTERDEATTLDLLREDIDLVPIIPSLDETIKINNDVFRTSDPEYNNVLFINLGDDVKTVDNQDTPENK